MFFIWLNDTTPDRHYWSESSRNWTTDFARASKYDTEQDALNDAAHADEVATAEVIVQEYNPQ